MHPDSQALTETRHIPFPHLTPASSRKGRMLWGLREAAGTLDHSFCKRSLPLSPPKALKGGAFPPMWGV